jgi:catechol 2,3-dioxygenase-like lactoylglutathione lyase family enzyme
VAVTNPEMHRIDRGFSGKESCMQLVNRLMMLSINVGNMPKAKAFYADILGLKVATDYRQDDDNWWVSLALPDGGATITLARATGFENMKPDTMTVYFETSEIDAAHKELNGKGVKVSEVADDLFGPGSGVRWFNVEDPDGNRVFLVQVHKPRAPF